MNGSFVSDFTCFNCSKHSKVKMSLDDYFARSDNGTMFNHTCPVCNYLYTLKIVESKIMIQLSSRGERNEHQEM